MKKFIEHVLKATRKYNVMDWSILKVCLIALGIILGTYFASFFRTILPIVWIILILTYVWIMLKTFTTYWKD